MSALGGVGLVLTRSSAGGARTPLAGAFHEHTVFVTGCGFAFLCRRTTGEEIARGKV
jgi:hypothetical protein